MALEAFSKDQTNRVVLEEYPEGVYVYVFRKDENSPSRDHLQDTIEIAKRQAYEDYGVVPETWKETPNLCLHGEH